ncbi:MAG: hypothetical protein ACREUC_22720, partial [Steroidobacteraceae bacterium]
MSQRSKRMQLALVAGLVAFALAGCPVSPTRPDRGPSDRALSQAERLAREGEHAGAAQAYEALAAQAPGELRDRFLLRAAREHIRADHTDQANAVLKQVSTTLPSADFALRATVAAELALQAQRADRALTELERIPQPWPRDEASEILALRARA